MGPCHWTFEHIKAADAALIATTSGSWSPLDDSTDAIIKVSCKNPLSNLGRMALSINLAIRISLSLGAPSLRVKVLGILFTAVNFS